MVARGKIWHGGAGGAPGRVFFENTPPTPRTKRRSSQSSHRDPRSPAAPPSPLSPPPTAKKTPRRTPTGDPTPPTLSGCLPLSFCFKKGVCGRESLDIISFGERPPWQGCLSWLMKTYVRLAAEDVCFRPQVKGLCQCLSFFPPLRAPASYRSLFTQPGTIGAHRQIAT